MNLNIVFALLLFGFGSLFVSFKMGMKIIKDKDSKLPMVIRIGVIFSLLIFPTILIVTAWLAITSN